MSKQNETNTVMEAIDPTTIDFSSLSKDQLAQVEAKAQEALRVLKEAELKKEADELQADLNKAPVKKLLADLKSLDAEYQSLHNKSIHEEVTFTFKVKINVENTLDHISECAFYQDDARVMTGELFDVEVTPIVQEVKNRERAKMINEEARTVASDMCIDGLAVFAPQAYAALVATAKRFVNIRKKLDEHDIELCDVPPELVNSK